MKRETLTLGQRVHVRAFMIKPGDNWLLQPINGKPLEGIVTAQRYRRNTQRDYDYDEYHNRTYSYTVLTSGFVAYDVTFSLHRKPLVCKPEHLEPL